MTTIDVIYRQGAFHPLDPVDVRENTLGKVQVESSGVEVDESRRRMSGAKLRQYLGTLSSWPEDPMEYQRRLRDEWG